MLNASPTSTSRLVSVVAVAGRNESEVLALAASVARGLDPSVAAAILASARERDIEAGVVDEVHQTHRAGAIASINGQTVIVGDGGLFAHLGVSVENVGDWPERLQRQNQRILFVAVDGQTTGFLGFTGVESSRRPRPSLIGALTVGVVLLFAAGCATQAKAPAAAPSLPTVPVVAAQLRDIPLEATYTGRVEAIESVELRPRVGGALDRVMFREGSHVSRGTPLFRIDQRPYAIAVRRAEADVKTVEAQLARAREEFQRAERLAAADAVSTEELERRRGEVFALEGKLDAVRAAVQDALLNLEFTTVAAPIDGRVGRAEVTEGNLVNGGPVNGTRLAVLHSVDPTYVYFELDPSTAAAAAAQRRNEWTATVTPLDGGATLKGPIDFIDNSVGVHTGTLKVRARLSNPAGRLLSGSVVRVAFNYGTARGATVVPEIAIGTEQGARYVLVAGHDGTVQYRPVSVGPKAGAWRVVDDAVRAGDQIVLPGHPGLRPGMKVSAKPEVLR